MTNTQKEKILNQSLMCTGIIIKDGVVYKQRIRGKIQSVQNEELASVLKCETDMLEINKRFRIASIETEDNTSWSDCTLEFLNQTFVSYLESKNDFFWARTNFYEKDLRINMITSDPIGEDDINNYDINDINDIIKFIQKHSKSKNTLYIGETVDGEYFDDELKALKLKERDDYDKVHNCEYDQYVLNKDYAEKLNCRMSFWDDDVMNIFWQHDELDSLTGWCKEIDPKGIYAIYHRKGKDWYIVPTIFTEYACTEVCIIPFEDRHILGIEEINYDDREVYELDHLYHEEDAEVKSKLMNAIKSTKNNLEFNCALASIFGKDSNDILSTTNEEKLLEYYEAEELCEILYEDIDLIEELRDEINYEKYSEDEIFSKEWVCIPELINEAIERILDRKSKENKAS